MALSNEEKQIVEYAKNNGKTPLETKAAIAKFRSGQVSTTAPTTVEPAAKPFVNKITDFLGLGGATKTFGSLLARQGIGTDTSKEVTQQYIEKPSAGQVAGAALQTAAIPVAFALTGGASVAGQAAVGAGLGYAYDVGQDLIEKKSVGEVLTPGMGTVVGGIAPVAIKGLAAGVGALKKPAEKIASATGEAITNTIPDSTLVQGTKQKATEIGERVPRFVARVTEATQEQAAKAEKIRTATPQVAQALKVDLPEKYINTVTQADPATKAAYKRVLDIADETPNTVGVKKNPTIVGGELAGKQYEIIEKQRKAIGNAIGEEVKKLGMDKAKVDMRVGLSQVDDVLSEQGIKIGNDGKLSFAGKYTPAERARIQELYTMARESGDVLTPMQVRDVDQLFSKLQRETRMEGVGDLRVDVNGQNMSMFRVFRDIYANQLENLSPELRKLNSQYRNIVTLTDDIEDSIIKTPNFNVTKSTDPAEFAKVNLRRIFGEAQSSPAYEAIADEMDTIARQLGYADAKPKDIAAFAQELRELYPESVPRTGFSGGIMSGLGDILQSVSQAGKADVEDQRKALRALIEATEQAAK
jgi:hypothetical protein